jgi:hypothetical protein
VLPHTALKRVVSLEGNMEFIVKKERQKKKIIKGRT